MSFVGKCLLPWVPHAAHLGHEFHTSGLQELDCNMRRAAYIGESVELLNVFQFAHLLQKLSSVQTYACSFYGSNLYDLYGPAANQLYRAWQVSVRDAWGVPRQTRTYLVDHLLSSPFSHNCQVILRKYLKFVQGLVCSMNPVLSGLSYKTVNNWGKCGQYARGVWSESTQVCCRKHFCGKERFAR